jgi:hypothetical protein
MFYLGKMRPLRRTRIVLKGKKGGTLIKNSNVGCNISKFDSDSRNTKQMFLTRETI